MATTDVVYTMSVPQRLDHLISGYIRINYNKECLIQEEKIKYIVRDISVLCSNYTGITDKRHYNLIISNTELKEIEHRRNKFKIYMQNNDHETIGEAYSKFLFKHDGNYEKVKVLVCGGGNVGKSKLVSRWITGDFIDEWEPYLDSCWKKLIEVDKMPWYCDVEEQSAYEEFVSMRNEMYRWPDCYVFMYDITNRNSFDKLKDIIQEAEEALQEAHDDDHDFIGRPGIIVGGKCDLEEKREISMKEGKKLAEEYATLTFMEVSAKDRIHVNEVFEQCARLRMCYRLLNETTFFDEDHKGSCCALL